MHFLFALGRLVLNCTRSKLGQSTLQRRAELINVSHTECISLTSRDCDRVRSFDV